MSNRRRLVSATRSFAHRINQTCVLEILTSFFSSNSVEVHLNSSRRRFSIVVLLISLQLDVELCSCCIDKDDFFTVNCKQFEKSCIQQY